MGNAFGDTKSMKEIIREQKRMVERSVRGLERDRASLQRDEQKLINDIRKAAKANQLKSVRIMAKDLVRIRKHQEKFVNLTAQLRAISLQMTSMASTQALTTSMKNITKAMTRLNKQINLPELNKVMQEFAKQSEQMEMKQEMISDSIDSAMDNAEDEEETDQVVNQVLDELGVSMTEGMAAPPSQKKEVVVEEAQPQVSAKDKELEDRFNNLAGQ